MRCVILSAFITILSFIPFHPRVLPHFSYARTGMWPYIPISPPGYDLSRLIARYSFFSFFCFANKNMDTDVVDEFEKIVITIIFFF